jgi:hypothetical protein
MLNDNDIITINISIFQKQLALFNNVDISPNNFKKRQELESSFSCFSTNNEHNISDWTEKKSYNCKYWKDNNRHCVAPKSNNRLHILPLNFTEEDKSRKRFIGFMNKLTESNALTILPQIEQEISNSTQKDVLYKIIWNFIENSSDKKYIQLLKYYDKEYNFNHFKKYISENQWYPSEFILNKNILNLKEDEYDIYCQYVKWKKQQINTLRAWCNFWKKDDVTENFERLIESVFNHLEQVIVNISKERKHILDYYFEFLYIIINRDQHKKYSERIQQLPIANLESSSKFLLKNLLEI